MKKEVLKKIRLLEEKAKDLKEKVTTGTNRDSLAETIKSKEQAENLKKLLKAL
jgi:hypothetical protein